LSGHREKSALHVFSLLPGCGSALPQSAKKKKKGGGGTRTRYGESFSSTSSKRIEKKKEKKGKEKSIFSEFAGGKKEEGDGAPNQGINRLFFTPQEEGKRTALISREGDELNVYHTSETLL